MSEIDELEIDNGKYTMLFDHAAGKMWFNRFDEEWITHEETLHNHYPRKMLISMMYKSLDQKKKIDQLEELLKEGCGVLKGPDNEPFFHATPRGSRYRELFLNKPEIIKILEKK